MLSLIQHPATKGWALNQVQGDVLITVRELLRDLGCETLLQKLLKWAR
jgi:hypothetical protein